MPRLIGPFAICALALAACSRGDGDAEPPPDIVLVTVDTLRADHLGCYGHYNDTSPHLDALAAEGILFERAISTMATTLPAHLSILTGLYPHQHGYVANHGAVQSRFTSRPGRRSVAAMLRDAGYTTAAFVSGPTVSSKTGVQDGFEVFSDHEMTDHTDLLDHSRRAEETTALALEWLATDPPRPFFLWVHYWDPHEPNAPLEPYASMYPADERLEELIEERRIHPELLRERFRDIELARLFAPELAGQMLGGNQVEMPSIDMDSIRTLLRHYDGDVRNVDDRLGELIAALRAHGRFEDALFVFAADHGQSLGQRDWLEHGRIELENTHVPLVLRLPGGASPGRFEEVVSLVDLMPTVLARVGGPAAHELAAQAAGEDVLDPGFTRPWAFTQRSVRDREWGPDPADRDLELALTLRDWRFYHHPSAPDRLYDLRTDPGELVDVLDRHPDVAERLTAIVRRVLEDRPFVPGDDQPDDASAELAEWLKSLGYTGE